MQAPISITDWLFDASETLKEAKAKLMLYGSSNCGPSGIYDVKNGVDCSDHKAGYVANTGQSLSVEDEPFEALATAAA
ncbi:hypothetical protein GN958_ATG18050 [Phytophthora infestans]|uniref:Uncharacterized protein n=1 Tax=Phytophthora infestans TaxID=4787 RepID=A0A8S9TZ02_PHYIN|nr:hypothetical protein GN958_ATG18050 [Phytophthora infestans]